MGQDDFGGYRFQLASMVYGLALTHRHRLPAAPGLFQPIMARLIEKLLLPEVWMYRRDVSRGGAVFNAHLTDRLHEEWDPVVRDDIIYSAYVQSCALLHDHLFAADRYAAPGSLTFGHWSFFWGGEAKRFAYDRESLNEHLYWQMVENGYLGVGHYKMMIIDDARVARPNEAPSPWVDAWCGALMNTWNRTFVHENYPRQVADFLVPGPDGTLSVRSAPAREVMGQALVTDSCDTGWVAAWASEMGDTARLRGLLAHVDRFMNPTWRDGGLYYPRNDTLTDGDGNRTEIDPMTGNVLLGYARLNVPDGLWGIYNEAWGPEHHTEPAVVAVDRDVEISRAEVVDGILHARLRRVGELRGDGTVTVGRVPAGAHLALDGVDVPVRPGEVVVAVPDGPAHDLRLTP